MFLIPAGTPHGIPAGTPHGSGAGNVVLEASATPWLAARIDRRLPEVFLDVHRLGLDPHATAPQDTAGRFHVLNLVEGDSVSIRTLDDVAVWREHPLAYAETVVIPAAVGHYEVTAEAGARLVRAVVR